MSAESSAYVQAAEFTGFKRDVHPVCEVELMSKLGLVPWDKVRDIPENKLLYASTSAAHWDAMQQRAIFNHGDGANTIPSTVRYRTGRTWRMLAQAVITASAGCRVHIVASQHEYAHDLHMLATRWAEQLGVPPGLMSYSSSNRPAPVPCPADIAPAIIISWLRKGAENDSAFCTHRALGSYWFQYKLVELDSLLQSTPDESYAIAKLKQLHPNDMLPQPARPIYIDHSCGGIDSLNVTMDEVAHEIRERVLMTREVQEAINVLTYGAASSTDRNNTLWMSLAELRDRLYDPTMQALRAEVRITVTEDQMPAVPDHYALIARLDMGCDQHCRVSYEARSTRYALQENPPLTVRYLLDEIVRNMAPALAEHVIQPGHFSHLKRLLQRNVEMLYHGPWFAEDQR